MNSTSSIYFKMDQALIIEPWLNIPADQNRYYQLFFYIPYGVLTWIFTAGLVQTLATALGRTIYLLWSGVLPVFGMKFIHE